jgi:hypothetical protein
MATLFAANRCLFYHFSCLFCVMNFDKMCISGRNEFLGHVHSRPNQPAVIASEAWQSSRDVAAWLQDKTGLRRFARNDGLDSDDCAMSAFSLQAVKSRDARRGARHPDGAIRPCPSPALSLYRRPFQDPVISSSGRPEGREATPRPVGVGPVSAGSRVRECASAAGPCAGR